MTEQEAAKIIKRLNFCGLCTTGPCGGCERKQAKDTVLSTLEEIQQYRAIGTVKECQEAREKQVPVKPEKMLLHGGFGYECKNCGNNLPVRLYMKYCLW